ncbi:hypothetical protein [Agrobacterium pusense]|uniref:hypothetical protein n=1 Tax=Agrobacterium pusense TaxID=648995 RepID=UPI003FD25187
MHIRAFQRSIERCRFSGGIIELALPGCQAQVFAINRAVNLDGAGYDIEEVDCAISRCVAQAFDEPPLVIPDYEVAHKIQSDGVREAVLGSANNDDQTLKARQ